MWVITTDGFFSAVETKGRRNLQVRARVRSDIVKLCKNLGLNENEIVDTWDNKEADYPYRIIVSRSTWASYLTSAAVDIDYKNFKDAVKMRQGIERAEIYLLVWRDLIALENNR